MIEGEGGWTELWTQFAQNLARGWSWSGFERSAFFTNDGTGHFGSISSVIGADQVADGRGIAAGDIDGDGDLDIVGTNSRTHPHYYVLRNDLDSGRNFTTLDLRAKERESAAGAKVLVTAGGVTQRRDVVLGSGYLTQHDVAVHFGLADAERVEKVEITWPDGTQQTLEDLPVNERLVVSQGSSETRSVALKDRNYNATRRLPEIEWDNYPWRLRLPTRPVRGLKKLSYTSPDGAVHSLAPESGLKLVNFWASWCANCRVEMPDLNDLNVRKPHGLSLLAVSLDSESDAAAMAKSVESWPIELPYVHVNEEQKQELLDLVEPALTGGSIVMPTSILVDARGKVVAVIEGTVQVEELERFLASSNPDH